LFGGGRDAFKIDINNVFKLTFTIKIMKKILDQIRKHQELHAFLRQLYGKTFGLYWLKKFYGEKIGFFNGKKNIRISSLKTGEKLMYNLIRANKPFMFGRYGSTEFRNLFYNELNNLCFYSGFFPEDRRLIKQFRKIYFESSKQLDILSVWNYKNQFFHKISMLKKFPNIKALVPLDVIGNSNHLWIKALKGKKVLVVHPFKATIEKQYKNTDKLKILPKLKSLEVIRAVQTLAGEKDDRFETWFDALGYMKKEIDKKDFDIVILGCGAYGFPLAAYAKLKGKQAIHLGGCTQLLFGIIGKRWKERDGEKKYWISPLDEDSFENAKKIEGGCYW